nr:Chain C, CHARGED MULTIVESICULAR BODY PROTEIN 1A [Homo sapiens]4A5X_D Chain D, CHARGED MULTIVESICULAR BODY PROTEIN 1A [Homo sapiens]
SHMEDQLSRRLAALRN